MDERTPVLLLPNLGMRYPLAGGRTVGIKTAAWCKAAGLAGKRRP